MTYVKGILSGVSAVIAADLLLIWWVLIRGSQAKATGLALMIAFLRASVVSPLFWTLGISLFAVFFFASRLESNALRVVFFWIPTVTTSCIGLTLASSVAYLIIRFRTS
jgi:hypothetical protein